MPRKPEVNWHAGNGCWRSQSGPISPATGKRSTVYFREIPNTPRGRREAERQLEAYLKERDAREATQAVDPGNPTVEDIADAFRTHCEAEVARDRLEPRTLATHRERITPFLAFAPDGTPYGDRPARGMRRIDLRRFVDHLVSKGHAPGYIDGILASVKACWAWAARADEGRTPEVLLLADPFKGLKGPKVVPAADRDATRDEVAALLRFAWRRSNRWKPLTLGRCAACMKAGGPGPCRRGHNAANEQDRAAVLMVRLAYHAGCRPGELCRARWEDYHPDRGVIVLGRHKTARKTGRARTVFVPPLLGRALLRWRGRGAADPSGLIFVHRAGKNGSKGWTSTSFAAKLREEWRDPAIAAGVAIRPTLSMYSMRDAFVSDSMEAGLTDAQTGALVGTSERMIRERYQRRREAAMGQMAERVRRERRGQGG